MSFDLKIIQTKSKDYLSLLKNEKRAGSLFPKIYALGNIDILKKPLLGLFCLVKCPGDLIFRTYDLARVLRDKRVPVIGGFHTPIEKDCLDLLLRGVQPLVCCPARGIQNMRLSKEFKEAIKKGRLCLLSPFEGKIKRPTIQTSQQRNLFVASLSKTVFVSYAEPGGKIESFCQEILSWGKSIYTFPGDYNKNLFEMGAEAVNIKINSEF